MRIENLAEHVDLIKVIGRWHWDEWGDADPRGSSESWTRELARKTRRDGVPATFVAFDADGTAIGSVTLVEHDMPDHAEFASYGPWIAGTFVVPDARGRGTGSALMQHVVGEARRWGIERLYLYTSSAEPFYAALGWRTFAHAEYENEDNTVMSLDL